MKKFGLKDLLKSILVEPERLSRLVEENGDFIILNILGKNVFIISNPDYIKYIFFQNSKNYVRDPQAYVGMKDFSNGLRGFLSEKDWKKDKDIAGRLLQKENMIEHVTTMTKMIDKILNSWSPYAENNTPINLDTCFSEIGLNNIISTLLGKVSVDIQHIPRLSRELFYYASPLTFPFFVKLFGIIPLPTYSYFKYLKMKRDWQKIGSTVITEILKNRRVDPNNIVTYLANAYGYKSYDELDDDMKLHLIIYANSFFIAGNDSTTGTLTAISVFLSLYPLVASKIRDEVKFILGDRFPNYDDLQNLKYTRAVIKETLRLCPPMACLARMALNDDTINNQAIKKGDLIIIPSYATHRDSKYWKNPEGFDPSRFLKSLTDDQRTLYMPFSIGERSCLGAQFAMIELTAILAMISQRYDLELTPGCSLKREPGIENRLNIGISMRVRKINH